MLAEYGSEYDRRIAAAPPAVRAELSRATNAQCRQCSTHAYCRPGAEEEEESEGSELEEPLLLRLGEDDHGSVGSEDTTECGSDTEEAIADAAAALGAAGQLGLPQLSALCPQSPSSAY